MKDTQSNFTKATHATSLPTAWKGKTVWCCIIFVCTACIVPTAAVILFYLLSRSNPDDMLKAAAKNDVKFKVYYLENGIFEKGARPNNLQYLLSFTDYIEIENTFLAEFSHETDVSYKYSVTETLVIKYQKSSEGNSNIAVFEKKETLSALSGNIVDSEIFWDGKGEDNPGGVYVIEPKNYIDIYRQFVIEQREQMRKEDIIDEKTPSFTAELLVTFTYNIRAGEKKINETLTRNISIPLSSEVFSIDTSGTSELNVSVSLREVNKLSFSSILLLIIWFTIHIIGIGYSIQRLTMNKDKHSREVSRILKKYSDEIIVSAEPADLSGYKIIPVLQFKELLKLAINLNKHILCFYNDENAEFCTFADGYAFCFNLTGEIKSDITKEDYSSMNAETASDWADELMTESVVASAISEEAEALFAEIDAVITESVHIKALKPYIEYFNSCKVKLLKISLHERLHAYKKMIDAVNDMFEISSFCRVEAEAFLKRLEDFKPRLQMLIKKLEEVESLWGATDKN